MKSTILWLLLVLAITGVTGTSWAQISVLPDTFEVEPPGGLTLRTWTGAFDDKFFDERNWDPVGAPSSGDSIVIPSGDVHMGEPVIELGALTVHTDGRLKIYAPTQLLVNGKLTVGSGGRMEIKADAHVSTGHLLIYGRFEVDDHSKPTFAIYGKLYVHPTAEFRPGQSQFEFKRETIDPIVLPALKYYDVHVDSGMTMTTIGNIDIAHELELNAPLLARPQDTIMITNGDALAITGRGMVSAGTIVRTIDSLAAVDGGVYRFHSPGTTMRFFPQGTPPTQIEITLYPDAYPQNLDSTKMFHHYYDIHQTGGVDFRLELSLQYDPREAAVISPDNTFSIYRSPDYGMTWYEIPATSVDTVNHIIRADNITGFSRYGFGRGTPTSDVGPDEPLPSGFELTQNFPNPFNPGTVIRYQLPAASKVTLKLYDVLGRLVQTLVDDEQEAGTKTVAVNGASLTSGTYFYMLDATVIGDRGKIFSRTEKMILLK